MNGQPRDDYADLAAKITRLAEERGWNQEDLARNAGLNRQTVRQIIYYRPGRRLRTGTISRCAKALGLSVGELRESSLERLLTRAQAGSALQAEIQLRRVYEEATQPELRGWLERNPDRASQLTPEEMDELLSLQGTGGPLTGIGIEHYVELLERKRRIIQQIHVIAGTEFLDVLETLVGLMHDRVQPYRDRT
jgi:transcriptional regulator with XRE-family HTH domain